MHKKTPRLAILLLVGGAFVGAACSSSTYTTVGTKPGRAGDPAICSTASAQLARCNGPLPEAKLRECEAIVLGAPCGARYQDLLQCGLDAEAPRASCSDKPVPGCQSPLDAYINCAGPNAPGLTVTVTVEEAGAPDSGTDTSVPDTSVGGACPGNTKQTTVLVDAACQSALEKTCCAELTACFDIVPAGGKDDCNKFAKCTDNCNAGAAATRGACQNACDAAAPQNVQNAYDAISTCVSAHPATLTACQK